MSQQAKYELELERVNPRVLDKAIDSLLEHVGGVRIKNDEFNIFRQKLHVNGTCIKLVDSMYPVDVYIDKNHKLVVNGDSMDVGNVGKKIKQFYKVVGMARLTKSHVAYDKRTKKAKLKLYLEDF